MAEINFRLEKSKRNKRNEMPLVARISFNGFKLNKGIGISLLEENWNNSKQKILVGGEVSRNAVTGFNEKIKAVKVKFHEIETYQNINQLRVTKAEFNKLWNKSSLSSGYSFWSIYNEYLETQKVLRSPYTIKNYNTVKNTWKAFEEENKLPLTFELVDNILFEKFQLWCFQEKEYSHNYVHTLVSKFKTFLQWAFDNEHHENLRFKRFRISEREKDIIVLYMDELMSLYNHNFENVNLDEVRDVYCFGCFTGLRYSDLMDLSWEHIHNEEIQKRIVKTKELIRIPLNKFAKEILEKYKNTLSPIPRLNSVVFNRLIKKACQDANIDKEIRISKYIGGKIVSEVKPKHELITSHTARKTFTTNSLILGVSERVVKSITGHKKESNFRRYVRLAEDHITKESNSAWDSID